MAKRDTKTTDTPSTPEESSLPTAPKTPASTTKKQPGTTSSSWFRVHSLELIIAGAIVIVGTIVLWGYLLSSGKSFLSLFRGTDSGTVTKKTEVVTGRRLDGTPLTPGQTRVYPVAVMIENLSEVRPQAGLSQASIVYEALVEGFATRFLALFDLDQDIPVIGPVRSSRPYYLEWLSEYNALYAHAGGSPDALATIDAFDLPDLNALYGSGAPYFYRDTSRFAPHNLFSSSELLTLALRDTGYLDQQPNYQPWQYKDDDPVDSTTEADLTSADADFVIDFSGGAQEVRYRYDPATNDYLRFNGGVAHTDANTGETIRVKNAIAQVIPPVLDVGEKGRLTLDVHGTGRAVIARDGTFIEGTWEKPDRTDRTIYRDSNGKEIQLNVGPTWIAVVLESQGISYPGMPEATASE